MESEKIKSEDYQYIRSFSKISIANICRKLNINRSNIMSGKTKEKNYNLVKREIEKEIAKIYLGDDK